jgi:hypothetical protein
MGLALRRLSATGCRAIARCSFVFGLAAIALAGLTQPSAATSIYQVDFTDYVSGSVDAWLKAKGFKFERDARSRDKIALSAGAQGLAVEALRPAQGLLVNSSIGQNPFSTVEIEWGVEQHPEGASYEKKVNNEAIMVHVFFGSEKKSSGSMFAPGLPYFIGLFLCNGDRIGHAYTGAYYKEGGRYVCLESATPGQTVVSRFDLKGAVQEIFGDAVAAQVSGYSVEVDTSASGGTSSAFIKRIKFLP